MRITTKRTGQLFLFTKSFILIVILICGSRAFSQNDNCNNASIVNITSGGFSLGTFTSTINDISSATVQAGETFPLAIAQAGQTQKSLWYKFTIPTHRAVRVTLAQNGSAIQAGDVGFSVYFTNNCLPGAAQISSQLTPIGLFGSTFHPCADAGDYLVQVSSKSSANGPVYITIQLSDTTPAPYNKMVEAYQFGTFSPTNFGKFVDYAIDCHSIENASEVCSVLPNYQQYTKSTWHTFTTPAYFDYLAVMLASPGILFYPNGAKEKFGYNLYAGDCRTQPFSALTLVDGCDSLLSNGQYADYRTYKCSQLLPNTTYSFQLFFNNNFVNPVRVGIFYEGVAPTKAPEPVSSLVPASNKLGVLPSNASGITTTVTDQLACNSRHSLHPCNPSLPGNGISFGGFRYNLSTFFTFTISSTSKITIGVSDYSPPYRNYTLPLLMRLFRQDITNTCSGLDTNNLVVQPFLSNSGFNLDCVPPGNYTLQISGQDSTVPNYFPHFTWFPTFNYVMNLRTDLGRIFNTSIGVKTQKTSNRYNLSVAGAFDTINRVGNIMQPMQDGITYTSKIDTFGCNNTVMPFDTICGTGFTKAIYRELVIPDSGMVFLFNNDYLYHRLFKGDADALAILQNKHAYPDNITGLTLVTKCLLYTECGGQAVCVVPGTYTHETAGSVSNLGQSSQISYRFNIINSQFGNPTNAENLGTLNPGSFKTSTIDYFSCKDNAVTIDGQPPCTISGKISTKAIYRQFYLSAASTLSIIDYNNQGCGNIYSSFMTLFRGKASDGIAGLTVEIPSFRCFENMSSNGTCNIFQPGWYTVVSYGIGPSYADPLRDVQLYGYGSYTGKYSRITVTASVACPSPKYNRPFKAAIDTTTGNPFLIQWNPRAGHTNAVPKTDTSYTLYPENYNCNVDTPFLSHIMPNCSSGLTKITYYVFRTTQESYVQIDTEGLWAVVYKGNARTDSASFGSSTLIQPCNLHNGYIQICRLEPGVYTLLIFATSSQLCVSKAPSIYIDQVGYSRFDHAVKAYDFGIIPSDSLYHFGKVGDINPIDPLRNPSNDIIYCTTGSAQSDPTESTCWTTYNSRIYNTSVNNALYNGTPNATANPDNIPRRNLWYTFVIDKGGYVKVRVDNKTIGKNTQHAFAVYKSDVNGTLPFSTVLNTGQIDSTSAQGLTFITNNVAGYYCSNRGSSVSFFRDPCTAVTERYYIVVDNTNAYPFESGGNRPNSQVDVSILLDSVTAIQPKFDHYYQASNIGSNLGSGTYFGQTDNYSCATRDNTDPVYAVICNKSLWYKFSTSVTGYIYFRVKNNYTSGNSYNNIQLFREAIPGDSTVTGLNMLNSQNYSVWDPSTGNYYGYSCISPGTYYIILPGCNSLNEYATPEIKIVEDAGDFCSAPVIASLNGAGNSISTVQVDCHTIGTDYGEFNPTLTCPAGAIKINYKTSWFKINITGTDTLDVTTFLTENTTALPSDIKYRLMNGNCGAMQERSCVQDAQTQDTYKCLSPGEYFIQVFTPSTKNGVQVTGSINLNLSAVHHADTCAPPAACLSNAIFQTQYNCNSGDSAIFINNSTYGSAIQYLWDFGYAGQTSTRVAPQFRYPELATAQTYTVTLSVLNTSCPSPVTSIATGLITIPAQPYLRLGNDTTLCTPGSSITRDITSWPGSTYLWMGLNLGTTLTITTSGTYFASVTYNGCTKRDTIIVNVNTITPLNQTNILCGGDSVLLTSLRGKGETYLWNTGSVNSSIYAAAPGIYTNNLNWKGCIIKDSFRVSNAVMPFSSVDTNICFPLQPFSLKASQIGATSYQWQNNSTGSTYTVTSPGQYWVKVNFPSCFIRDTLNVNVSAAPVITNANASVCGGQSFTLPWGAVVTTTGIYRDTIRYAAGCDSLRRNVAVTVQAVTSTTANAGICQGQSYTLPWGTVVLLPGVYKDTLRYNSGCDSLRRTVNLSVASAVATSTNVKICIGQTYTLANGIIVNTTGVYSDTLHYTGGCDSLRRTVNLTVQNFSTTSSTANICSSQSYTLPWGTVVNTAGIYRDTLHYLTGCDSIRRSVTLTVQTVTSTTTSAGICQGQAYTLPWGTIVNTAGVYKDTLRYSTGCDSIRRTLNLSVLAAVVTVTNAKICAGQSYTLANGIIVNTSGVYADTLRYASGCDSVRRNVNLTVQAPISTNLNAAICPGQNYTLPWGAVVNTAGIYRDTLHYTTGCDSVRRTVNLIIQNFTITNTNANICTGQTYTLPWGTAVSAAGIYRDTLHYTTGCDSIRRAVTLTVQTASTTTANANICAGQSYTLPWGTVVSNAGTYQDTLRYVTGCDSIRRTVNITVQNAITSSANASICSGQTYTLPWGAVVNISGTYRDTLRYTTGCDSLRRAINLIVQSPTSITTNPIICAGQSYTLPWGQVVNTAGTYKDTLHYITGCDSLHLNVNVSIQSATSTAANAVICAGQSYTLPWGAVVNGAGTYRDTLRYTTGCDSIRRSVNLAVQTAFTSTMNATVCSGQSYTLPSGIVVNTAGIYKDTLKYTTGCDSLRRTVNLSVTAAALNSKSASICSDQSYALPWGTNVNTAGNYRDTVKTAVGCDSLIREVLLTVRTAPLLVLTKSNDVNCIIATSNLNVSGASTYIWSPASTLNNASLSNPVASPLQTTRYAVTGTAINGCSKVDSIEVKVVIGNPENGYLVPSGFTPNNDGLNDCFGVPYWGNVTEFNFTIYNRFGQVVFKTSNVVNCWDGMYKGVGQNSGAYVYVISANGICGKVLRKGVVMLVR